MKETKAQMQARYEQVLQQERAYYTDLLAKYRKLQDSGDELFKQSPEYVKMNADLISYKDAYKTVKRSLEREREIKQKLQIRIEELETKCQKLNNDTFSDLQKENELLKAELEDLRAKIQHNARGAGRKPSPERKEAIKQVQILLDAGASDKEIMEKMQISRATFYRYKRSINN